MYQPQMRTRRFPGDEGLAVQFFYDTVEDQEATTREGRPCFKDIEFVRITVPAGDWAPTGEIHTKRVDAQYRNRFPDEYAAFKATSAEAANGSPLKMWPAIGPSAVKELSAAGFTTIEQLVELSERDLTAKPWVGPYVDKARQWLDSLNGGETLLKLQAKIATLEQELLIAKTQNASLVEELAARPAKSKSKASD